MRNALTGRRGRALAAGLAIALAVSGCSSPPTTANDGTEPTGPTAAEQLYAEIAQLSGQQRRDRLVELAQEEGELDLYTSMTADVADAVAEAFNDAFDVDVNVYRAGSETVLQRILQEHAANYQGNDVVETNANELFALNTETLLATYEGERRDLVPEAGQFDGWTATRFNLFAVSWNTDLVPADEVPTSWEDLADPKWDGRLSLELSDYDWFLTLYGYWRDQGKTDEEIDQIFADMAAGAKITQGHTVQGELLSAGEYAVVASNYSYIVQRAKDRGAPVDYLPFVEPVIARPNGIGLMKDARHPAAAMLFADWLLEEGQALLQEQSLTPAIPPGDSNPLDGVDIIPVDIETLLSEGDEWSDRYADLVATGEQSG